MVPAARTANGPLCLLVHSTRAKLSGLGEWLGEKHGTQRRRVWWKLHLGVDAPPVRLVTTSLTGKEVDETAELVPLLDQVVEPVAAVITDVSYDGDHVFRTVSERHRGAAVVVPPRSTAVFSPSADTAPIQRDRHLQAITEQGRMSWQKSSGYNARASAEGTMTPYKRSCLLAGGDDGGRRSPCAASQEIQLTKNGAPLPHQIHQCNNAHRKQACHSMTPSLNVKVCRLSTV